MENVKFSYNFGYFHSHEASLALMLVSIITFTKTTPNYVKQLNINHYVQHLKSKLVS